MFIGSLSQLSLTYPLNSARQPLLLLMYLPMIGARSFFVCCGHRVPVRDDRRRQRIRARARALSSDSAPTAPAITFCAVRAFCVRFAMIISTVTES